MDCAGLRLLAGAVTADEVANPTAFDAVALNAPAEFVEVVALAHFGGHGVIGAEGFGNFNGQIFGLSRGSKVGIGQGCEGAPEHFGTVVDVGAPATAKGRRGCWEKVFNRRGGGVAQEAGEAHPVNMH